MVVVRRRILKVELGEYNTARGGNRSGEREYNTPFHLSSAYGCM